jgi:putative holliday junction resolvase
MPQQSCVSDRRAALGAEGGVLDVQAFARVDLSHRRLLGLDLGSKRIGLALSDVTRTIASPLTTLTRGKFSLDAALLLRLADEHDVGGFVLGLPLNLDGSQGQSARSTRAFAANLARLTRRPILLWDERLTTVAAERALLAADASRRRRAAVIDKVAASLILQGALDRLKLMA